MLTVPLVSGLLLKLLVVRPLMLKVLLLVLLQLLWLLLMQRLLMLLILYLLRGPQNELVVSVVELVVVLDELEAIDPLVVVLVAALDELNEIFGDAKEVDVHPPAVVARVAGAKQVDEIVVVLDELHEILDEAIHLDAHPPVAATKTCVATSGTCSCLAGIRRANGL